MKACESVYSSGMSNVDGLHIPVKSNWNLEYLSKQLVNYTDKEIVQLLQFGFPIECAMLGQGEIKFSKNHAGAEQFPDDIDAYIAKELKKGTLIGPFKTNPFGSKARFSPMNTRPKKESSERRIIMDLSFPIGDSVNSGINKDVYRGSPVTLRLPGVDALLEVIYAKGRACKIFRRDLKAAYKQIPVCVGEICLLGYVHRGLLYFDVTLLMGLTNSAYICQRVTDMIMYIYRKEGYAGTNYLDDLAAAEIQALAQQAYDILADILKCAGAQEACAKVIEPSTCMLFLGILIDTVLMRLSIVPERMHGIRQELKLWLHKQTTTLKQLQSLIGKLNFCAMVV